MTKTLGGDRLFLRKPKGKEDTKATLKRERRDLGVDHLPLEVEVEAFVLGLARHEANKVRPPLRKDRLTLCHSLLQILVATLRNI